MIEVSVDSGDLQRVVKRMTRFNKNVRQGVQREVKHSSRSIQARARRLIRLQGAVATGRLRSSVYIRFTRDHLGAVIGTNVNYAGDIEFGQKPGKWPNVGVLMQWVKRKIVSRPKRAVRSATFLIGRKIFKYGTEPKPFLYPSANKEWFRFRNNIQRVLKMS